MKIKKKPVIIAGIILILIIILVIYLLIINSNSYKLKKIGYNKEETNEIIKINKRIDDILKMKYNKYVVGILKETYYLDKNFNEYLKYANDNNTNDYKKVVALVNVNANKEFYTDTKEANTNDGKLLLVNKYNYITEKYSVDLKDVDLSYAYNSVKLDKEAADKFIEMAQACNDDNRHLVAIDGYRDFEYQQEQWDYFKYKGGNKLADAYAARAGYSEHQTGLALDVNVYPNEKNIDFEEFDEFDWLQEHAAEYGFILRYPKGKEDITGYAYESWHYRYVGVEVAKKIKELDITYDEYYAYFIEK